ncbi:MAG: radical SAM protein, partial [Proteobacteria bacterium]|nr:radical SAM protein [Pseudomonadota bacterium]
MSRIPTIEWQVAGACNYDCSYCIQSRRHRRGKPDNTAIKSAISCYAALEGVWEIKCSGGEPFAHVAFLGTLIPRLMEDTSHRVSVLTNFSASHSDLMRFAALTRRRLSVFSASLHLEYVTLKSFGDKAEWFVSQLDPEVSFVVNQVVVPGQEATALECRDAIQDRGLRWFPQLYKTKSGVADYDNQEKLRQIVGDDAGPRRANRAPDYEGRLCWSGVDYFTVDKEGNAW